MDPRCEQWWAMWLVAAAVGMVGFICWGNAPHPPPVTIFCCVVWMVTWFVLIVIWVQTLVYQEEGRHGDGSEVG